MSVETHWPCDPRGIFDRLHRRPDLADLWVPSVADFPPSGTAAEVRRNYSPLPAWWLRPVFVYVALFMTIVALTEFGPGEDGPVRRTAAIVALVLALGLLAWATTLWVAGEIRWFRARHAVTERIHKVITTLRVPLWGLFVNRIRLGAKTSGDDTPDDMVFVFDLRVPSEVLRRQRAAVTAWIDEVLEASQRDRDIRLSDSFAKRDVISGVEIFGEPMRGVWVWRKPSILPLLYLGWALADPRTAEVFDEFDAVFLRKTPKLLQRRSQLLHQE